MPDDLLRELDYDTVRSLLGASVAYNVFKRSQHHDNPYREEVLRLSKELEHEGYRRRNLQRRMKHKR